MTIKGWEWEQKYENKEIKYLGNARLLCLPVAGANLFGLFTSTLKCLYNNWLIQIFYIKCL